MTTRKNIRWWERILRYACGVSLLAWAIAGGPWWTYVGVIPLATAAWGFCPLYWTLRINVREE